MMRNKLSKILFRSKNDDKINEVKLSLENFLFEISKQDRDLFSYTEVQNMLLDIYNLTK